MRLGGCWWDGWCLLFSSRVESVWPEAQPIGAATTSLLINGDPTAVTHMKSGLLLQCPSAAQCAHSADPSVQIPGSAGLPDSFRSKVSAACVRACVRCVCV